MKKLKTTSVFLLVLTIASIVFNVISDNAELLGIKAETITIIGLILSTVKLAYDQWNSYSEEDMVSFGSYTASAETTADKNGIYKTAIDHLEDWKLHQK